MKTTLEVVDTTGRTLLTVLMAISYFIDHFTASILTTISLVELSALHLPVRLSTLSLKVVERESMHHSKILVYEKDSFN